MEAIALTLSILNIITTLLAGLLIRSFLPTYFVEKGKNLASKEDLSQLTDLVERVKAQHATDIERFKADLSLQGQILERRRRIYEEICAALRIFISGHRGNDPVAQQQFHGAYSAAWLWSSDEVLNALNHFIALQVQVATNGQAVDGTSLKHAYSATVLAMRKDVGFAETEIDSTTYQFVRF